MTEQLSKNMKELRTLGLIGGLSWHSTVHYYRHLNSSIEERLGEYRSAPLLLSSVDFGPIVQWQLAKQWDRAGEYLAEKAQALEKAGAEAIIICSNTMHKVAALVSKELSIPLLHIANAIAREIRKRGQSRAVLLGTRYTMNQPFLLEALRAEGVEAHPPIRQQAKAINEAIFKRLVFGRVESQDQDLLNTIAAETSAHEALILGCTELALLVNEQTPKECLVDSLDAHCGLATDFILGVVESR